MYICVAVYLYMEVYYICLELIQDIEREISFETTSNSNLGNQKAKQPDKKTT